MFFRLPGPSWTLSRHHAPCQHSLGPRLRASSTPPAALFLISQPIPNNQTHSKQEQDLPRRFLIVLSNRLQSLCSFTQPDIFNNRGGKESVCTELLPWQSSTLHLSVRHQPALTSQSSTLGCLESSNPQALLAVR